ncbi:hypothetical protein [Streptomyces adustus]|uniref:hypothetical protein n=1 Tax=Streptomyces adustus TaxID=1609272 RepID=UPI0037102082
MNPHPIRLPPARHAERPIAVLRDTWEFQWARAASRTRLAESADVVNGPRHLVC